MAPIPDEQQHRPRKGNAMPDVDLSKIRILARDKQDFNAYIDDFLNNECAPDDPPYLSDLITGHNKGGQPVLEALAFRYENDRNKPMDQRFMWKIQVLCDEWGNKPQPGDVVIRKIKKKMVYGPGKPVPQNELELDKINGVYEKKWFDKIPYPVDVKGCITCEFIDAVYFLNVYGIHGKSKAIMSMHKNPYSCGPQETPKPGEKLHVWYHRYQEVNKDMYESLPKIKKIDEPKRGLSND